MGVIVVVCAAFGLTVSETKTEIICLRAKGMPESTATFSVPFPLSPSCMESTSYVGVFLPCDQGLHFLHQLFFM